METRKRGILQMISTPSDVILSKIIDLESRSVQTQREWERTKIELQIAILKEVYFEMGDLRNP